MSNNTPKKNNNSNPKTKSLNKESFATETEINKSSPSQANFTKWLYYILPALLLLAILAIGLKKCLPDPDPNIIGPIGDPDIVTIDPDDFDGDKIPDDEDPDIDGDGIPNEKDECEFTAKGVKVDSKGCIEKEKEGGVEPIDDFDGDKIPDDKDPDIDGDGIPNEKDECEFTAKGVKVDSKGCIEEEKEEGVEPIDDFDGDKIPDDEDPDIDGDGIPNEKDECEFTAKGIKVDSKGCIEEEKEEGVEPIDDFDGDKIPDDEDPDIDGDGIPNEKDESDFTPKGVKVNAFGCSIEKVKNYEKEIHNLDNVWENNPEKIEDAITDVVKNIHPSAKILEKFQGLGTRPIIEESFEALLMNQLTEYGNTGSDLKVLNVVYDEGKITKILIERLQK